MEEKHTPGPWEADGPRIYGTTKTLVATVGMFRSIETAEANARLIAAAPDLLDALEILVAATEQATWVSAPVSAIQQARAAIAKAKGTDHA